MSSCTLKINIILAASSSSFISRFRGPTTTQLIRLFGQSTFIRVRPTTTIFFFLHILSPLSTRPSLFEQYFVESVGEVVPKAKSPGRGVTGFISLPTLKRKNNSDTVVSNIDVYVRTKVRFFSHLYRSISMTNGYFLLSSARNEPEKQSGFGYTKPSENTISCLNRKFTLYYWSYTLGDSKPPSTEIES